MSNLAVLPIIIPLLTGIVMIFFHNKLNAVRTVTKFMAIVNLVVVTFIGVFVYRNGMIVLETGGWEAPFGIVLVADALSITLVISTNIIAVACAFYAAKTLDNQRETYYFYSLFQILIAGVSGAFLTGDIFNLFVFFEVLLMASYGLIVLGGKKQQLRESVKYLLINLFSSMLFVTTIAFLYSVTGTLNMAHLSQRVAEINEPTILSTIAILLFIVFATKGALFPLYFWLPKSYAAPPVVISALFGALLTKVGVYSIIRVFTLIFNGDSVSGQFFIALAGLTMLFGVIGALSTNNVKLVIAYNIIPAVGFMLMGIGVSTVTSVSGTVYYLVHDMIIKAALFLLVGIMIQITGTDNLKKMGGMLSITPGLGWLFLLASYILAGLPPFSGFFGKLLLIRGAFEEGHYWIVAVALLSSLLILLSVIKVFIGAFWGELSPQINKENINVKNNMYPAVFLLAFSVLLGLGAEIFYPIFHGIADGLVNPSAYIDSVLKE